MFIFLNMVQKDEWGHKYELLLIYYFPFFEVYMKKSLTLKNVLRLPVIVKCFCMSLNVLYYLKLYSVIVHVPFI